MSNCQDLIYLTRQLSILTDSGLSLQNSLNALAENEDNPELRRTLNGVSNQVKNGQPLDQAMAEFPDIFDTRYVTIVAASKDSSQQLAQSLKMLAVELENGAE